MSEIGDVKETVLPQYSFKDATPDDANLIVSLSTKSFIEGLSKTGKNHDTRVEDILRKEEFNNLLDSPHSFITYIDGKPAGFMLLNLQDLQDNKRVFNIELMGVLPEFRSPVLLTRMIEHLFSFAKNSKPVFNAWARESTTYKITQMTHVRQWIEKNYGYKFVNLNQVPIVDNKETYYPVSLIPLQ